GKQSLVLDLSPRLRPRETSGTNSAVLDEWNTLEAVRYASRMLGTSGASLDAVLLGQGWDQVESEWQIDGGAFPRGFAPILDPLSSKGGMLGLRLGIFRDTSRGGIRMPWLARRGYEVASSCPDARTMCLAGENYGRLVLQRCRELAEQGNGLFFIEPVETICNEAGHGHAPGAFSRYAIVRSLENIVEGVRARRPGTVFSFGIGAWLSPWWLTFADYLAPVNVLPIDSVPPAPLALWTRTSAVDRALYEFLRKKNLWFPMRNLITEPIGAECPDTAVAAQPVEAFTDAVITDLCRGTSLHLLGLSPSALDTSRWAFLARAMRWAADRAGLLSRTEMIGGDPGKDDCYGYVHAEGTRAIVLARNPASSPATLRLPLAHSLGLDPSTKDLVIERVYPTCWVAPRVYQSGETIGIPLKPWETAIYEIYPLAEAQKPLIAGVPFSTVYEGEGRWKVTLYDRARNMTLLNPSRVRNVRLSGEEIDFPTAFLRTARTPLPLQKGTERLDKSEVPGRLALEAMLDPSVDSAALYVHLSSVDAKQAYPSLAFANAESIRPLQRIETRGGRAWYVLTGLERSLLGELILRSTGRESSWTGHIEVWVRCVQRMSPTTLSIESDFVGQDRLMPPVQAPVGIGIVYAPIGELDVWVK
ncbi:MAG: hypothetical protein QHI48_08320, partial [Bacteroidota bacterium]|nr:hypothetical protein [Bacteroidota bacterium]